MAGPFHSFKEETRNRGKLGQYHRDGDLRRFGRRIFPEWFRQQFLIESWSLELAGPTSAMKPPGAASVAEMLADELGSRQRMEWCTTAAGS